MRAKTRVRLILWSQGALALLLPLLLALRGCTAQQYGPEKVAISFIENLARARFAEAQKVVTPESLETLQMFEVLVGSQADELAASPVKFTITQSEMNETEDTLTIRGILSEEPTHKSIRKVAVVLIKSETGWRVDCRENILF